MLNRRWWVGLAALVLAIGAARPALAAGTFPRIPIWAYAGAYQDLAHTTPPYTRVCQGLILTPLADSVRNVPRTITVRFLRDRVAEARPDFGGYRVYRVVNRPDSTQMSLVRRYSLQPGDNVLWFMSKVDPVTLQFKCGTTVVHDSIATFLDPDSSGTVTKVCPLLDTRTNRCIADSVFRLIPPPGPHDGFLTYYAITYELLNTGLEGTYEDMFVPDLLQSIRPCGFVPPQEPDSCANLNNKLANLSNPVVPSGGPKQDLERVLVVPNPFRASEEWDLAGGHELHFINLPTKARIRIYTLAGDLIRVIEHDGSAKGNDLTTVRDFARWNLKNADGKDVASGIYLFRVDADAFAYQGRFVVIR